jgi:hypothetical protein
MSMGNSAGIASAEGGSGSALKLRGCVSIIMRRYAQKAPGIVSAPVVLIPSKGEIR